MRAIMDTQDEGFPANITAPDRDAEISLRAYRIWERNGRPFGEHDEHWEQARAELEAEEAASEEGEVKASGMPSRTWPGL